MQGLVSVTMDNKLTLCLEAEVRQGWKGGKDQGVRTSKIQFNVVRKECDVSVRSFVELGTGRGRKGKEAGTGKPWVRVHR